MVSVRFAALIVPLLFATGGCARSVAATSAPARRTVLVELFTSQGCSSCPAADAFVRELPALGLNRARVIPLTFHVDYWDGLGWKDPFSAPAFTDRQRRYVQVGSLRGPDGRAGLSGLYTPQMIIDGTVHFSGRERDLALAEIRRAAEAPPLLDLAGDALIDGDRARATLRVSARDPAAVGQPWQAFVAIAARSARTNVTRGENGGETLEESAVVRALSTPVALSLAADATTVQLTVARPRDLPWAAVELSAVVQSAKTLRVAAALAITTRETPTGAAR